MSLSLQDADNYKPNIEINTSEIFVRYMGVIQEFLVQCMDVIFISDLSYYRYILLNGIETISHVFRNVLLYTNNINVTYHHSQKAFYYYVEFIGQIGDEKHSFLQLNSKDATLFVYKKTIFEIKKEFSAHVKGVTSSATRIIIDNISMLTGIYNRCLNSIFCTEQWEPETCKNLLKLVDNRMCKFTQNILDASFISDNDKCASNDVICAEGEYEYNNVIAMMEQVFEKSVASGVDAIPIMEVFGRKIKGKNISIEDLRLRLAREAHDRIIEDLTPLRYVNWLLSDN
tara:strand:- start:883 stop:1740 length:858 start_codon:yes stop_codon:yes gene_type:complete